MFIHGKHPPGKRENNFPFPVWITAERERNRGGTTAADARLPRHGRPAEAQPRAPCPSGGTGVFSSAALDLRRREHHPVSAPQTVERPPVYQSRAVRLFRACRTMQIQFSRQCRKEHDIRSRSPEGTSSHHRGRPEKFQNNNPHSGAGLHAQIDGQKFPRNRPLFFVGRLNGCPVGLPFCNFNH